MKWPSKMDNPEKLAPLGTQDKRLKQTNKNKTQYVLDTITKESSRNILSRLIVCENYHQNRTDKCYHIALHRENYHQNRTDKCYHIALH
jgi:hypothetical protein